MCICVCKVDVHQHKAERSQWNEILYKYDHFLLILKARIWIYLRNHALNYTPAEHPCFSFFTNSEIFFLLNQTFLLILKITSGSFLHWILFPLEIRHNRPRSATFSSSSRFPLRLFLWVSLVTNVSRRVLLTGQMFCKLLVSKWWMPPVLLEIWSTPSNVRVVRF